MKILDGKKILLIICGGIAAYKSLELIRLFKKKNASIKTILTKSGSELITPLSISSISPSSPNFSHPSIQFSLKYFLWCIVYSIVKNYEIERLS